MEFLVIHLIFALICASIMACIASSKGRSVIGWFFGGFFMGILGFLGIIGIIIVAVLPNLKEQRFKEEALERENRRLREQLMQEQIKTEAFRQHAAARLDAHDAHLGVDTRAVVTALPSPDNPAALTNPELVLLPASSDAWPNQTSASSFDNALVPAEQSSGRLVEGNQFPPTAPASVSQRQWYYEVQGKAQGPISDTELVTLAQQGLIVESTLVWTQQLGNWRTAGSIKSLQQYLKP
jgi:type II secretory pathway pseudopilin PulG